MASAVPASDATAQNAAGIIQGRVIDASTGKPIAGAAVLIKPSRKKIISGKDGRYVLRGVAPGSYTVRCSKAGYRAHVKRRVAMSAGQVFNHTCRLRRLASPDGPDKPKDDHDSEPMAEESRKAPSPAVQKPRNISRRDHRRASGKIYRHRKKPRRVAAGAPMAQPISRPPASVSQDGRDLDREGYDKRNENPFVATTKQPLSTFSIDVDTASYSNVRRFIAKQNRLPPKDAVKIEELINYFDYDYKAPTGNDPFAVDTEISVAPWNQSHRLVRIGLQGKSLDTRRLPPSNLVFLIDVSGSTGNPDKLPLLKGAFSLLVNELRPNDRVAIVVYAGAAGLVLPSTRGKNKDRILWALDQLHAGGSTAGAAGIKLAYQVARKNFIRGGNNRVILATDGDFNVGQSSDAELVRMIEGKRKQGVFLTVLGFGSGNYQDAKMEKLADKGNGNHAYIDSLLEAKKVLVSQMGGTLFTIAKDVKLQIEFNPTKVKAYRLIGYENRMLAAQDFNDDKKDAGELGAGHNVTALYEIIPAGSKEKVAGVDELKYQQVKSTAAASSNELMTLKLRYKKPAGQTSKLIVHTIDDREVALGKTSKSFRFATAVAELGLLLRDSEHKGNASYAKLISRARGALGRDRQGYRKGFLQLARKAQKLAGAGGPKIAR